MITITTDQIEAIQEQLQDWLERPVTVDEVITHLKFAVDDITRDPVGYLVGGFQLPKMEEIG